MKPLQATTSKPRLQHQGNLSQQLSSLGKPIDKLPTEASVNINPNGSNKRTKKVTLFDLILKGKPTNNVKTPIPKVPLKTTVDVVSAKHIARKKKKRISNLKKKLLKVYLYIHICPKY